ncbi:sugar transferase [Vibrio sp. VB16]|uniref:sugar transferase n=1 Tax=Vibrio sp. VB16 TaxID=2785746 RepID=UPI0018A04E99|nr:sugar transferase [Vibrio sp. VB16]UGA54996.1 sugar transferase [Vibrio sp. VB16]
MVKRFLDIVVSILLLLLFFPIMLLTSFLVYIFLGSPIFFRQFRPGKNSKTFELMKFRTMRDAQHDGGQLASDEKRLTRFGVFLRSTSLDELPSLVNVLKGEMSLVGPRPLLVEYLPLYNDEQLKRHDVRPGLTGWAQVNGRNAISWQKKFEFDVWYIENQTLWLDIKIMLLTVKKVFLKEGISAVGHVTIEPFRGNDSE